MLSKVCYEVRTHSNEPLVLTATPFAAFAPLQLSGVNLMTPKLIYILYNLVGVAIVLWKIKAMGLLPVTSADWISLIPSKTPAETAIFG